MAHSYKVKQKIHFLRYSYKRAAAGILRHAMVFAMVFSRLRKREMTDRNEPLSMRSRSKVGRQSLRLGRQTLSPFLSSLAPRGRAGIQRRLPHWGLNTLFLPTCLLLVLLKRADYIAPLINSRATRANMSHLTFTVPSLGLCSSRAAAITDHGPRRAAQLALCGA